MSTDSGTMSERARNAATAISGILFILASPTTQADHDPVVRELLDTSARLSSLVESSGDSGSLRQTALYGVTLAEKALHIRWPYAHSERRRWSWIRGKRAAVTEAIRAREAATSHMHQLLRVLAVIRQDLKRNGEDASADAGSGVHWHSPPVQGPGIR